MGGQINRWVNEEPAAAPVPAHEDFCRDHHILSGLHLGSSVYAYSIMLLLVLLGIASGSLAVARVAGIMAAKRTPDLIPLCHPLQLTGVEVALTPDHGSPGIDIEATVRTTGKTGVEMEALTAVSAAALTVYDMCKAVERSMRIEDIRLIAKSGGKSGDFHAE